MSCLKQSVIDIMESNDSISEANEEDEYYVQENKENPSKF